jgi:hypothetical protein
VLTSNGFLGDPTFQNVPPYLAGFSNETSQTASLGSTNLVVTPAVGLYRVSVYEEINSGTLPVLQTNIQWTDDNGAQSATPAGTGFSTIGGFSQGNTVIRVASGNITFTTTAAGTINYSVFLRAEFIGN